VEGLEEQLRELVRAVVREELALLSREGRRSEDDALVSVRQAAALVDVCTKTVHRWIAEGSLPAYGEGRLVRLRRRDVLGRLGHRRRGEDTAQMTPEQLAARDFEDD